ncbi:MAG: sugar transferase [Bacteroidales bacterium]|nr:sugar transferase [Bacteroidales bacterium]
MTNYQKIYLKIIKRPIGFLGAFIALLFTLPITIIIIISLKISNKGAGVFYSQFRPGYKGKIFRVFKFKTMSNERDTNGRLLPDSERITKIGKIVRSCSIDELPQLLNILKGDMSFIGPRPLLIDYLPLYNQEQARRHNVRPGMSGWAQINGRNAISWEEKFEYDLWYVDNFSFWLDLKILFITIKRVFFRDGINASKDVTMEPFKGSK